MDIAGLQSGAHATWPQKPPMMKKEKKSSTCFQSEQCQNEAGENDEHTLNNTFAKAANSDRVALQLFSQLRWECHLQGNAHQKKVARE